MISSGSDQSLASFQSICSNPVRTITLWWEAAGGCWNPWISWLIFIHTLKNWHPGCLTSSLILAHCTDRHFWQTLKNKRAFLFRHFRSVWKRKNMSGINVNMDCAFIHFMQLFFRYLLIILLDGGLFKAQCYKSVFFQFNLPVFLRSESAATDITAVTSRRESVGVGKRTYINRRDAKYIWRAWILAHCFLSVCEKRSLKENVTRDAKTVDRFEQKQSRVCDRKSVGLVHEQLHRDTILWWFVGMTSWLISQSLSRFELHSIPFRSPQSETGARAHLAQPRTFSLKPKNNLNIIWLFYHSSYFPCIEHLTKALSSS